MGNEQIYAPAERLGSAKDSKSRRIEALTADPESAVLRGQKVGNISKGRGQRWRRLHDIQEDPRAAGRDEGARYQHCQELCKAKLDHDRSQLCYFNRVLHYRLD